MQSLKDREQLISWDRKHLWHPFTQMQDWLDEQPVIIARGAGIYLIDIDGNRYIDGIASMWTNVHGHNHPDLNAALKNQIDSISHATLLGYSNIPAIELAQKLVEITPVGLNKVFYSDNGSTAVEVALKMAFQYWQHRGQPQRNLFVHFDNAYHGDTIGAMSVGGIDTFHNTFNSLLFDTVRVSTPQHTSDAESRTFWLNAVARVLAENEGKIAGIILEPLIQGAGGMLIAPKGFLNGLAALAKRWNTLLIVDEVMTGFGRTGRMWACEHEDISPDILCTAKGLTAGYLPLAATLTTDEIYSAFLADYSERKTFFHGHTYTGNPLGCAVALENIAIFQRDDLIDKLQSTITHFEQKLQRFYELKHVADVRVCGMAAGIELMKDTSKNIPYPYEEKVGIHVCQVALSKGAILRPLVNTIVLMPPLQISISELDTLLDIAYSAIDEVTNKVINMVGVLK
ncbi:adenosylmethionine--8-amino-7-oxononanoate transaminase [Candidatus Poribacteria bacterium]|nr:adenosylmethionine--8-amino-7-oxononanoate transaminase [Candidatus Poribacteria bacterium]MYB64263.1 adenosylmethionine--8-amino-7-oxononanoate transaminase [Candidatus Poribacteria bacterium]